MIIYLYHPTQFSLMVTASAPAKIILFGEHAVVYGEPSIAGAIGRRIYASVELAGSDTITIQSDGLNRSDSFTISELSGMDFKDEFRYVKKAIQLSFERAGKEVGLKIKVESEVPPASGLGSSAAVSVATIKAVTSILGLDIDKDEIAALGHRVEVEVQGSASPTDTATATYGGLLFIQPREEKYDPIEAGEIPIVVGYTGDTRSTKVLVDGVRRLKDAHPDIMDPVIGDVGRLTRKARECIIAGDDLGDLMNINHGLLEAMGVGSGRLAELVHAARAAGARGAKITGAGGGGCMIAYAPDAVEEVKKAIEACGCKALIAPISTEGVKLE